MKCCRLQVAKRSSATCNLQPVTYILIEITDAPPVPALAEEEVAEERERIHCAPEPVHCPQDDGRAPERKIFAAPGSEDTRKGWQPYFPRASHKCQSGSPCGRTQG